MLVLVELSAQSACLMSHELYHEETQSCSPLLTKDLAWQRSGWCWGVYQAQECADLSLCAKLGKDRYLTRHKEQRAAVQMKRRTLVAPVRLCTTRLCVDTGRCFCQTILTLDIRFVRASFLVR